MTAFFVMLSCLILVLILVFPIVQERRVAICFLLIVAVLAATKAHSAPAEDCKDYATVATAVLEMRQEGASKREVTKLFKETWVWGDALELAIYRAFKADPEVEPEDFRASTFKRCRAGEL